MAKNLQYRFTKEDTDAIRSLTNDGKSNYYKAYEYIHSRIEHDPNVTDDTKLWFNRATEINADDPLSAANTYIRSVTNFGLSWDNKSPGVGNVSDHIGSAVIQTVLNENGVPDIGDLIASDINIALEDNGQSIGGWGGSFYYWDVKLASGNTVGQEILSNSSEYAKFIAVTL